MRNYFAVACLLASTVCAVAWIITHDYRLFLCGMIFLLGSGNRCHVENSENSERRQK